jgi:hypothetical protein
MEGHGGGFDPAAFDAQALNLAFHGGWASVDTQNRP